MSSLAALMSVVTSAGSKTFIVALDTPCHCLFSAAVGMMVVLQPSPAPAHGIVIPADSIFNIAVYSVMCLFWVLSGSFSFASDDISQWEHGPCLEFVTKDVSSSWIWEQVHKDRQILRFSRTFAFIMFAAAACKSTVHTTFFTEWNHYVSGYLQTLVLSAGGFLAAYAWARLVVRDDSRLQLPRVQHH